MSFKRLNLSQKLIDTLEKLNYTTPTEIQKRAIPILLQKRDLLATSQTGTGKTAAFILPLLENLTETTKQKRGEERYKIDALILAPTRELVIQIDHKIDEYAESFTHKSVPLYGGIKLGSQVSAIRAGANIAVGTTARVLDHVKNGSLNLSNVKVIILDEADKMLEMGFIDNIRKIISLLPKQRHSVMFSATFPKPILSLAKTFLKNPLTIEIDRENLSTQQVKQLVHYVNEEEKLPLLSTLIKEHKMEQVLLFTNTKVQADKIVEHLKNNNIKAQAIHGDKTQRMRMEALSNFKEKKIQLLIATDVAARGIDILNLPHVINFELPTKNEEYIHRIGRTGRAGEKGEALSLVCEKELFQLKEIEELINIRVEPITTENFEFTPHITLTNRKSKKLEKRDEVNLKRAKELAEKMLGDKKSTPKGKQKRKKSTAINPTNKRHF